MTSSRRIALVTSSALPDGTEDDRRLVPALASVGLDAAFAVWDRPGTAWSDFALVVLRSCWDYHRRAAEFAAWIASLERAGVTVANDPTTVRWNLDKRYLRDFERRGAAIPETAWLDRGAADPLREIMGRRGWDRAVIKPAISAGADDTHLVWAGDAEGERLLHAIIRRGDVLVQEFVPEISAFGEWSFVFFEGRYSHAVVKRAAKNEFRVQEEFGGSAAAAQPTTAVREEAERILGMSPSRLLYARVDAAIVHGRLVLMELEAIEPSLFLSEEPDAAGRFASAIDSCQGALGSRG